VLKRRDSATMIERLARASALLVPLDCAHHAWRWPPLMREVLLSELQRFEPDLEPALRRRASSWYARHDDLRRAAEQAAAAGDARRTGDLLWPDILSHLTHGRNDLVRDWLAHFPAGQIAAHAPLALSASFSALAQGDADDAQHWSLVAVAALDRSDGAPDPSLSTGLAIVSAIAGHDGAARMGEIVLDAAEREAEDSLWRPFCLLLRGVALYLQEDRSGADLACHEAIRLSGNDAPVLAALGLAQRGMIALEARDWELASELTDRATMVVEEWELAETPLSALAFAAAAASRAHEGRIDEAKLDLRRGIDRLAALGDFVPWYAAETRILLAHASLWLADVVGARTLLAEASRFARRTQDASVFSEWFEHAWAYMDTLAETSLSGPSSLTIAELRILRFLPSHRSFREIAEQLGVSANTVKTQAHAVYRKLGAASRSEAVDRAMSAGLLGQ
jgi:LuxR family maltose regulon positive regulatory protein